jgi:hypothetical protein
MAFGRVRAVRSSSTKFGRRRVARAPAAAARSSWRHLATFVRAPPGEVAERLNAPVSKTGMGVSVHRGFESPPLRWLVSSVIPQADRANGRCRVSARRVLVKPAEVNASQPAVAHHVARSTSTRRREDDGFSATAEPEPEPEPQRTGIAERTWVGTGKDEPVLDPDFGEPRTSESRKVRHSDRFRPTRLRS